jgi:hypothetical protein
MKKGIVVFLAVAGLTASQASATLLTYEGFNYTVGSSLDNQNGGTGWAANWGQFLGGATSYTNAAGSLTDPTSTLLTSAGKVQTAGAFAGRYNNAPGYGTAGTTNYFSVLIQLNYTPTSGSFAGLQLFNNTGQGDLFVGLNGSGANWGLQHGSTNAYSTVAAASGQTVFLVLEADYGSASDTFKLYVNPTPGAAEPASPDATVSYLIGTQNGLGFNAGGPTSFDELRIGTTYADVTPVAVPEPSTVILVAGSLISLLGYRSRRGTGHS